MDDVSANEQRNAEAAFFHRNTLQFVDNTDVDNVDDRTDAAVAQTITQVVRRVAVARVDLAHLANLFAERHILQQGMYAGRRITARLRP